MLCLELPCCLHDPAWSCLHGPGGWLGSAAWQGCCCDTGNLGGTCGAGCWGATYMRGVGGDHALRRSCKCPMVCAVSVGLPVLRQPRLHCSAGSFGRCQPLHAWLQVRDPGSAGALQPGPSMWHRSRGAVWPILHTACFVSCSCAWEHCLATLSTSKNANTLRGCQSPCGHDSLAQVLQLSGAFINRL